MKRAGFVAVLVLALAACGAPDAGRVVEKQYDDADTWIEMRPTYTTTCNAQGICTQQQTGVVPIQHYDPEHWLLKLDDGDDSGWITVDERTWQNVRVGQVYDSKTGEVREA